MKTIAKKVLSVMMAAIVAIPSTMTNVYAEESAPAEDTKTIQILQTSDIHGKFVPFKYATYEEDLSGSLAQISTVIKEKRNENTILIDVGDSIQDNSADLFLEDDIHPVILGFNTIGYDFWCLGNHEFNFGVDTLKRVIGQFKGTVLAGNVYDKDGQTKLGATYEIVNKDGVDVAVIGVDTPNITKWDSDNLEGYKVTNPIDETRAAIAEVKDKADVIVVACHMDFDNEFGVEGSGALDIAKACPEADVILAAHGHTKKVEYVNDGKTLIAENLNFGQTMNDIDITVKSDGNGGYEVVDNGIACETISMKGVEADPEIVGVLEPYNERAKADAQTVIGKLAGGDLVRKTEIEGITQAQIEESAMMNLINDVQMYYGSQEGEKVDVSAAAVFSPEANIKEGDIKKCDASLIYKYDNTIYKLKVTGKQLKQYMEWSVAYYNTYRPGDLTISFDPKVRSYLYDIFGGVKYDIDITKDAGNRVTNLTKKDGTPITDEEELVLAVNNYRADSYLLTDGGVFSTANGDTFPVVLERNCYNGIAIRDLIAKYIQEVKNGTITPEYYGDWKVVGNNWDQKKHAKMAELINQGIFSIVNSEDGRTPNVKTFTEEDLNAYINSCQAKISSVTTSTSSVKVALADVLGADGYKVYCSTDKNFKSGVKTKTTSKNSVTFTSLKANKKYYVKAVAVFNGDSDKTYTKESSVKVAKLQRASLAKANIKSIKAAKKSAKVSIKAVNNATGYKVYYSTDKNFKKGVKSKTTTKTSITLTKLTSNKTYYVKVKAYAKDADQKVYYGSYGTAKKVKVK